MSPSRATAVEWTVAAVVVGLLGASGVVTQTTLGRDSVDVPATVVGTSGGGRFGTVVIVFTTQTGERVRAKVSRYDWNASERTGATVRVRYVPDDPAGTVGTAESIGRTIMVAFLASAGVACILISCYLWIARFVRWRRRRPASPVGRSGRGTRQHRR